MWLSYYRWIMYLKYKYVQVYAYAWYSYATDDVVTAASIVDDVIVVNITETVIHHHTWSVSNNLPNRI